MKERNRRGQFRATESYNYKKKMKDHFGTFTSESEEAFNEAALDKYDFAGKGTGKPCGGSHIAANKACKIGGGGGSAASGGAAGGGAPSSKDVRALDKTAKAADKKAEAADKKWRKGGMKDKALQKEVRALDREAKAANKAAEKADKAWRKASGIK